MGGDFVTYIHVYRETLLPPFRKEALSQYAHATDITQVYQDSFSQFYECMKLVDKEEEYVQFIQDNKQ